MRSILFTTAARSAEALAAAAAETAPVAQIGLGAFATIQLRPLDGWLVVIHNDLHHVAVDERRAE